MIDSHCCACVQKKRLDRERRVSEAATELQRRLNERVRRVPLEPIHGSGEGAAVNAELLTPRGSHFRPMQQHLQVRPSAAAGPLTIVAVGHNCWVLAPVLLQKFFRTPHYPGIVLSDLQKLAQQTSNCSI